MIVEPDFFGHWKTRLFTELVEDKIAPLMVLRLWAHCQQRKKWRFKNLDYSSLRVICGTEMDGGELQGHLIESGFLRQEGDTLIVHDWEKSNRMLVSAWKNGNKGGRPFKSLENRQVTDRKPDGNRTGTSPSILSYLSNLSSSVRPAFEKWMAVRRGMGKKPKDWDAMFSEQATWLVKDHSDAQQTEILSQSIRNGWQGLFEPSSQNSRSKAPVLPESGSRYNERPIRQPTNQEIKNASEIAKREVEKLRQQLQPK